MEMKTKMSKMEFEAKLAKLKEAENQLNRLFLERGISISHSGVDGESFLSDSAVVTENLISIQQNAINSLRQEISTAEIIDVKADTTEDGKLKVGYGSRLKMRYFFSDDETQVDDEYIIICNVDTFDGDKTYGICTPASPLYKFIEGQVAGYRGTYKGSASQNTTIQYDFEILEVLPPDPRLLEKAQEEKKE
jgi:hypothetical protein